MCKDAYKRLNRLDVMQLLNGQKNLSGMNMCKLDLSETDFRNSSFYRARVDEACLDFSNFSCVDISFASFKSIKASQFHASDIFVKL